MSFLPQSSSGPVDHRMQHAEGSTDDAASGGLSHAIIIRVKRRRDQEPSNTLCVVEADKLDEPKPKKLSAATEDLTRSIAEAGFSEAKQPSVNADRLPVLGKLVLTRVCTLPVGQEDSTRDIDAKTIQASTQQAQKSQHILKRRVDDSASVGADEEVIDTSTVVTAAAASAASNDGAEEYKYQSKSSVWVPRSKKMLRSALTSLNTNENDPDRSKSFFVLDMNQMQTDDPHSRQPRKLVSRSPQQGPFSVANNAKIKIYDPLTRSMGEALSRAWQIGDFTGLSNALIRGAKVDFQSEQAPHLGVSALMAAARHANTRMVVRLLDKGASVFLKDAAGLTAMDHLQQSPKLRGSSQAGLQLELQAKLQQAATKQFVMQQQNEQLRFAGATEAGDGGDNELVANSEQQQVEYVYDIFCSTAAMPPRQQQEKGQIAPFDENIESVDRPASVSENIDAGVQIPVIAVEGIHITTAGQVELQFAYDSDWSDLGDDEDPDSNDERYHGNDYPEEEDGEEDSATDDDDDVENTLHAGGGGDDGADSDGAIDPRVVLGRAASDPSKVPFDSLEFDDMDGFEGNGEGFDFGFGGDDLDDDDRDVDDGEDGGGNLREKLWNRRARSAGHVMHYGYSLAAAGTSSALTGAADEQFTRDTPGLQRLWGEEQLEELDGGHLDGATGMESEEHRQRLRTMHGASGMEFGSNPHEFDRHTGLPKNGYDVEDDDDNDFEGREEMERLHRARQLFQSRSQAYASQTRTPFGVDAWRRQQEVERSAFANEAYDSELDGDDEDDEMERGMGDTSVVAAATNEEHFDAAMTNEVDAQNEEIDDGMDDL